LAVALMMHSSDNPPKPHAKFIPSEEIAAFAAWNFGSLGAPMLALPDETAEPEEEVVVEPEEPVQVQLERAWDEGYAAGLAHGREEATNEGNHKLDEYVQGQGAEAAKSVARAWPAKCWTWR
jgi:flagellar assembly protein FliH